MPGSESSRTSSPDSDGTPLVMTSAPASFCELAMYELDSYSLAVSYGCVN